MALHWDHIMGVNGTTPSYTKIEFSNDASPTQPKIYTGVNTSTMTDQGYIVTTRGTQPFKLLQRFNDGINTETWNIGANKNYTTSTGTVQGGTIQYKLGTGSIWSTTSGTELFKINASGVYAYKTLNIGSGNCTIDTQGAIETKKTIKADQKISTSSYMEAQYFNATSDRRAKDNIQPLTTNALDWINNTTIYSFNYLSNPDPTLGVIAQELHPLGNVSFVKNAAATGKDGDYMAVAESKLVYVAFKAIQELSKKVEELQNELQELKQSQ